jgi:hypothetical protein
VPELLILIVVIVLLTLMLGLPLLLKPESRIPDYLTCGLLGLIVLGFAWSTGDWWVLIPVLAIAAFIAWLDKGERKPSAPPDGRGMSSAVRLRFRLWRSAHYAGLALIVGVLTLMATGTRLVPIDALAGGLLVSMTASFAFRFSLNNALAHDRRVRAGVAETSDPHLA